MLLGLQVLEEDKMISQEMLWTQYFTESYLGFKLNSLIDQIAKAIIYRPDLFRTLVLNLSQSDMSTIQQLEQVLIFDSIKGKLL